MWEKKGVGFENSPGRYADTLIATGNLYTSAPCQNILPSIFAPSIHPTNVFKEDIRVDLPHPDGPTRAVIRLDGK